MKKFKSILCLLLALIMVLGLTACDKDPVVETKPNETNKPNNETPVVTDPSLDRNREVTIKWMTSYISSHSGYDEVSKAVVDYVKEKYNINLELVWIEKSDYDGQSSTIINTGDGWDVAYVGGNVFRANVSRNAFLALDDYLAEGFLPTAQEELTQNIWDAGAYAGSHYAVIPTKDWGHTYAFIYNQKLMDKFGLTFPEKITNAYDLVDWMYAAGAKVFEMEPEWPSYPLPDFAGVKSWRYYDSLALDQANQGSLFATSIPGMEWEEVKDEYTVFGVPFTDEFVEILKTRADLVQKGYCDGLPSPDDAPNWFNEGVTLFTTRQGLIRIAPDAFGDKVDAVLKIADSGLVYTDYVQAAMWTVNANAKDPDRCLDFIEALCSDEYLINLLKFGIEGKDWADTDNDNVVEILDRNSDSQARSWYYWYSHNFCNVLTGKVAPGNGSDFAELMMANNNRMTVSPMAGFSLDQSAIQNELAALSAIQQEYADRFKHIAMYEIDQIEPLVEEFRAKLLANGYEKALAEVQRQVDEWVSINKK